MTVLTKSFCKKYDHVETASLDDKYTIEIYDSILDVEEQWALVSTAHDIFFNVEFLRCIEDFPATGIKPYYGLVMDNGEAVGIIYFQSKYVKLRENLRKSGNFPKNIFEKLSESVKNVIVSAVNFQTIVCGNLLLTGKYGFYFKDSVKRNNQFYLVIKATEKLSEFLNKQQVRPGLVLIKDFFTEDMPSEGEYHQGFTKFTVQPKMLLQINPNWKTFDDYLADMKSKYRVRARKALQKSLEITKVVFDEEDIGAHRVIINTLYKNVSDQAAFNAFLLHEKYFENAKTALGRNMTFTTYWRKDKMVAFFTSIKNYDVLDAHFLGYDPIENVECHLYLNMLFDLIKEGLEKKVTYLDMSRTAVEIKSTVGAVPHNMYLYLKHSNPWLNKSVGLILGLVKPDAEYIIRSPFRE
ncbi:MAG: N-acetyltransferase [Saprospiraceae bacterium]|nr:N-acetyltransferase [Saprospiraceae bacterium]